MSSTRSKSIFHRHGTAPLPKSQVNKNSPWKIVKQMVRKDTYTPSEHLMNNTRFTANELKQWYKGFLQDCPDGRLLVRGVRVIKFMNGSDHGYIS